MSSISLQTNVISLVAQNSLSKTTSALNKSLERLSTGKKINHASDGAADLALSTKFNAQISGTKIAQDNVQQGMNMLNLTDDSLQNINTNLTKIRDLTVKAANGTYSQEERDAMKLEAQGYADQITSIANSTKFNDITLLDGSVKDMQLQIGADTGDTLDITSAFSKATASALGITSAGLTTAFSSADKANEYISTVDNAIKKTNTQLSTVGSYNNRLSSTLESLSVKETNYEAANSVITDVDYAEEISNYIQLQILQQTDVSMLTQANNQSYIALQLLR